MTDAHQNLSMGVLDCQSCGACCEHGGEVTVMIETDKRVPAYMTRSVRRMMGYASYDHYDRRRMARADGVCIALRGQVGAECACKIYDRRPAICHEFEPGSDACLHSRSQAGIKP